MKIENLNKLKKKFNNFNIDGYIVPKNDNFFSEYVYLDRLKSISNFSGSAGLAIILKNKNFLFVDGRYTVQAKMQSGKLFKIVEIHKHLPKKMLKNITLGFDPMLFTNSQLNFLFGDKIKLRAIKENLIDNIVGLKKTKLNPFYSLNEKIVGQNHKSKIKIVSNILKQKKADFLYISAPENVAWILNIRGSDVPFSPIPNCNLLLDKYKNIYLFSDKAKVKNLIKERKIKKNRILDLNNLNEFIKTLSGKNVMVDKKTCSIYVENILSSKFKIINRDDPCYLLKSIKNSTEIENIKNSHVVDGAALTKFLIWIKNTDKKISEIYAGKKLETFRKKNKNYLFPSFDTIAGSGPNSAIIHYKATPATNRIIDKRNIFLCDSGGQYKYGTTDVTRTICFTKQPKSIRKFFTLVLKGHIAVVTSNLKPSIRGKDLDYRARYFLKKVKANYAHGTGHGVGFFSNVHEGPQSISKFNNVKLREGMVLSNEPGFYKEGHYGIRIENLVYIKKKNKKLFFENLTFAPIDKDLIEYKMLTKKEKDYLFDYHLKVYSLISKYLSKKEKKWLIKNL